MRGSEGEVEKLQSANTLFILFIDGIIVGLHEQQISMFKRHKMNQL